MYNSKRFETVKNIRENKKISNVVQAAIGVLAVVLAALIVWMMVLVSGIQGTARVVNYAGLVRGETQRLVKMEIAGQAEDGMMESVESFINGLRFGDDELTLVRLGDKSFQTKMEELASCFESLKQEIYLVREKGFEKTDIIDKSEKFFDICDEATGSCGNLFAKARVLFGGFGAVHHGGHRSFDAAVGYEFIRRCTTPP